MSGHGHSHSGNDHGHGGHGGCSHGHALAPGEKHLLEHLGLLSKAWSAKNTDLRWLLIFCVFMTCYSIYEITYGLIGGEYEFINTGFNYGFRAIIIAVSICAAVYTESAKSDNTCTYGYMRIELLAVFSASACLYIMSVGQLVEELHHVMFEESDSRIDILTLSLKFAAEMIMMVKFKDHIDLSSSNKSAKQENMTIMIIHIFILTINDGFLGLCYAVYGVEQAGPIIECATSTLTIILMHSFLFNSGKILLMASPEGKQNDIILKQLRQVNLIDGVIQVLKENFWNMDSQTIVGTIVLQIHADKDADKITNEAKELLSICVHDVAVEIKFEGEIERDYSQKSSCGHDHSGHDHHGHGHGGHENHGNGHSEPEKHGHSHGSPEKKHGHGHSEPEKCGHNHGSPEKKHGHGHSEPEKHGHSHGSPEKHGHSHGSPEKHGHGHSSNDQSVTEIES